MSALHIAALMLRRGRPALRDRLFRWVVGNEVSDRRGDLAAIGACLRERRRDAFAHVARPALGCVKGDDADRRRILALKQVADHRKAVGVGHVGLGPG